MLRTNFNNSELEVYKKAISDYTKKYNDYRLSISSVATYGNSNILPNSSSLHDSENSDLTKFWDIFYTVKQAYEAQEAKKKERSNHTLDSFIFAIKRSGSTPKYSMFDFKIPNEINLDLNCPCYIGVDLASKEPDETVINIIKPDPISLHAENEGLYVRIKELEEQLINGYDGRIMVCTLNKLAVSDDNYKFAHNENYLKEPELGTIEYDLKKQTVIINELNVQLETKDKRIAELEGNLIIMCELGNKVLS